MAEIQKENVDDWRKGHSQIMAAFLRYLNAANNTHVLKGGSALSFCYNLDRFSEDIDLDGIERTLLDKVDNFCRSNGYVYRIAKNSDLVQLCMIHYGNVGNPLKIEASYRLKTIDTADTVIIDGILTYGIDRLCALKALAYVNRDKIRDLYDVAFICNNYYDRLSPPTVAILQSMLHHKGLEHFDYMVATQPDELIDSEKLAGDFLKMYDRLGLLLGEDEIRILESEIEEENSPKF